MSCQHVIKKKKIKHERVNILPESFNQCCLILIYLSHSVIHCIQRDNCNNSRWASLRRNRYSSKDLLHIHLFLRYKRFRIAFLVEELTGLHSFAQSRWTHPGPAVPCSACMHAYHWIGVFPTRAHSGKHSRWFKGLCTSNTHWFPLNVLGYVLMCDSHSTMRKESRMGLYYGIVNKLFVFFSANCEL